MWRSMLAGFCGLIAWFAIVSALNWGLRLWLPGYSSVEPQMAFTLVMMGARLTIAAVASIAAGAIIGAVAPKSHFAAWAVGFALVVLFVPVHLQIWGHFPVWYHLTFLAPLAPLVVLGRLLAPVSILEQTA